MKLKDILAVLLIAASIVTFVVGCEFTLADPCVAAGHSWLHCARQR